jgi:hypothetical protein
MRIYLRLFHTKVEYTYKAPQKPDRDGKKENAKNIAMW